MKKRFLAMLMTLVTASVSALECSSSGTTRVHAEASTDEKATVYFTREITPESLVAIYRALGREAHGKVGVKLSMGEPGGHNYLKPELVGDLVRLVEGTFIDANTAYGGRRATSEEHLRTAREHGFTAIAPVDILDQEGEIRLPLEGMKHLKYDIVGSHLNDYDFIVNLSHFKGHAMGGFGGAIKNMSIGIASSRGKTYIHSAGESETDWGSPAQDDFLESMAEAAKAVADHLGEGIVYISVMNNLSVDCDCDSNPADPQMHDVGILASLDPVALDQACVDLVYASEDHGKVHLVERMESRNGIHTVVYGEQIGLGTRRYELVTIER